MTGGRPPSTWEGAGVVSSYADLSDALTADRVDPLQVAFAAAGAGIDTLGVVVNPLDSLFAAGIGWLIEHVDFLSDPLDALAGDPAAVLEQARAWQAMSAELGATAIGYRHAAATVAAGWNGADPPTPTQGPWTGAPRRWTGVPRTPRNSPTCRLDRRGGRPRPGADPRRHREVPVGRDSVARRRGRRGRRHRRVLPRRASGRRRRAGDLARAHVRAAHLRPARNAGRSRQQRAAARRGAAGHGRRARRGHPEHGRRDRRDRHGDPAVLQIGRQIDDAAGAAVARVASRTCRPGPRSWRAWPHRVHARRLVEAGKQHTGAEQEQRGWPAAD